MSTNRIERTSRELRQVGRSGPEDVAPAGSPAVLRAPGIWRYARDVAKRFSNALLSDRSEEFLKALIRKIT